MKDVKDFAQGIAALIIFALLVFPVVSLFLGFAVRCFLWAAGFRSFF